MESDVRMQALPLPLRAEMIALIVALWGMFCAAVGFIGAAVLAAGKQAEIAQLHWNHIEKLEDDKRALTESLCRANGTPYVQPRRESTLIPGSGWYDAPDTVYRKPEDEN